MTLNDFIAEGRALERQCWILSPAEQGPGNAVWHVPSDGQRRRWLTVDASFYQNVGSRYISIVGDCSGGGVVERLDRLPEPRRGDIDLVATETSILPPIDAVFAFGSDHIGSWLAKNNWKRAWGYNSNFPAEALAEGYQRAYQACHPLYGSPNIFAMIGGWHFPFPDDDWSELASDELLLTTLRDAEPWMEAWRRKDGSLRVIERIT